MMGKPWIHLLLSAAILCETVEVVGTSQDLINNFDTVNLARRQVPGSSEPSISFSPETFASQPAAQPLPQSIPKGVPKQISGTLPQAISQQIPRPGPAPIPQPLIQPVPQQAPPQAPAPPPVASSLSLGQAPAVWGAPINPAPPARTLPPVAAVPSPVVGGVVTLSQSTIVYTDARNPNAPPTTIVVQPRPATIVGHTSYVTVSPSPAKSAGNFGSTYVPQLIPNVGAPKGGPPKAPAANPTWRSMTAPGAKPTVQAPQGSYPQAPAAPPRPSAPVVPSWPKVPQANVPVVPQPPRQPPLQPKGPRTITFTTSFRPKPSSTLGGRPKGTATGLGSWPSPPRPEVSTASEQGEESDSEEESLERRCSLLPRLGLELTPNCQEYCESKGDEPSFCGSNER